MLADPPAPLVNFRMTALLIASALFMEQLDGTVLSTALPVMARSFGSSPLHMNIALTAYLLSLAVFIPASGYAADRFGTRTVFRAAIMLFAAGSIACGLAENVPLLVASRVVQGIGGAMMVPVGRLVMMRSVAKSELVAAFAWVLVPGMIGPMVGPPLGGFFVTYLNWRWIFYINVPMGLAAFALSGRFIPQFRAAHAGAFDRLGFLLSGTALFSLMFGFELASRNAVPVGASVAILGAGLMAGAAYMAHARRVEHPILDLRLLRDRNFAISVWAGALTRITGGALPFLLPMMLQLGFGISALQSGLMTFCSAAGAMLMKACAPPILRRFGFRSTLVWNGVLATLLLMSAALFRPNWPYFLLDAVMFAGGFFQSLQFTAYNTVAYADIAPAQMSSATSFYTTFQQLMLSAGICVAAAILAASLGVRHHNAADLTDFSNCWVVLGIITIWSAPLCAQLKKNAGAEISGHFAGAANPQPVATR